MLHSSEFERTYFLQISILSEQGKQQNVCLMSNWASQEFTSFFTQNRPNDNLVYFVWKETGILVTLRLTSNTFFAVCPTTNEEKIYLLKWCDSNMYWGLKIEMVKDFIIWKTHSENFFCGLPNWGICFPAKEWEKKHCQRTWYQQYEILIFITQELKVKYCDKK